jgi:hypothetical protein
MMPWILASINNNLPQNNSGSKEPRKRERFSTTIVKYQENEVRELLALELPAKKKKKKKKDNSKVLCFKCKELGHYSSKCPEGNNRANTQGGMNKDLSMITCFKCKQKGHYSNKCTKKTPRLQ